MSLQGRTKPEITVVLREVEGREGLITVQDYFPSLPETKSAFLWVHGGGFSSGGLKQKESDAPARALAEAGIWVRTIEYRLAPRANPWKDPQQGAHPGRFPAALHDVVDVALSLSKESSGPISIGGGSAGANLAAGAVLMLRDEGHRLPLSVVLGYGTFHAELPHSAGVEAELTGFLAKWAFNPTMTRRMNLNYVGDPALLVPGYAFPGGADLTGFPPSLLLNSRNDRLRSSGEKFAVELGEAGTEVRQLTLPGTHAFFNAPKSKGFSEGITEAETWLKRFDG